MDQIFELVVGRDSPCARLQSRPVVRCPLPATPSSRVLSIDIFRGLTMLVMIFVNDLASVKGLPWWTYHMPGRLNGMTYVDVVFPAFLFIVGMSIPLSINKRLEQDPSQWSLWRHILLRSFSLIVLGIFLANAGKVDPILTGIPKGAWGVLGLIGAILLWNVYPRTGGRQALYGMLKYAGLILLVAMFVIFRRKSLDGHTAWLDFSYWEILGLIGRAYLAACILYIPLRKKLWAPAALLVILTLTNAASRAGWIPWIKRLPYALWPFDAGALPSIVIAGIVASSIFLDLDKVRAFSQKARWALIYAATLFAAGYALSPLGVMKNRATPTWCLYSSAISVILFLALYWIVDVRGQIKWAAFLKPAGSNTLLTYLLPDLFYFAAGLSYAGTQLNAGLPGAIRAAVFTALMLALSGLFTKLRVRMQL